MQAPVRLRGTIMSVFSIVAFVKKKLWCNLKRVISSLSPFMEPQREPWTPCVERYGRVACVLLFILNEAPDVLPDNVWQTCKQKLSRCHIDLTSLIESFCPEYDIFLFLFRNNFYLSKNQSFSFKAKEFTRQVYCFYPKIRFSIRRANELWSSSKFHQNLFFRCAKWVSSRSWDRIFGHSLIIFRLKMIKHIKMIHLNLLSECFCTKISSSIEEYFLLETDSNRSIELIFNWGQWPLVIWG